MCMSYKEQRGCHYSLEFITNIIIDDTLVRREQNYHLDTESAFSWYLQ